MTDLEALYKIDRIHPYPAKFTVDLALDFIKRYTKPNDLVYDPFMGSGTTLLAALNLNRNSIGTDINFIAVLISRFKVLRLSSADLSCLKEFITDFENSYQEGCKTTTLSDYPSINHWFCEDSIRILSFIKNQINGKLNENQKVFADLVFSSIINTASNQESDTRYAAVYKPKINIEYVATIFIKKFWAALSAYESYAVNIPLNAKASPVLLDSKKCEQIIGPETVDLVLTSPPYPNTYDYYLYHKHRMYWLDYDYQFSMESEIGSRREFSSLKHPKEKFDEDMLGILVHVDKTIKHGGYIVLVMGDGRIRGEIYDAKINMEAIGAKLNWSLVDYSFTFLDETSRSFQKSYRTKGKKEHILVFRKK